MHDKLRHFFRCMWRAAGYWGVAWLAWIILSAYVRLSVMELHATQPGGYNAPPKVAVRKRLVAVETLGYLFFLIGFLVWSERRKSAEQAREVDDQQSNT